MKFYTVVIFRQLEDNRTTAQLKTPHPHACKGVKGVAYDAAEATTKVDWSFRDEGRLPFGKVMPLQAWPQMRDGSTVGRTAGEGWMAERRSLPSWMLAG